MESIDEGTFIDEIKKAQIICCPEYGYFIDFEKPNPYHKTPFEFYENVYAYRAQHELGDILFLKRDDKLFLTAFIIGK
jgi:hypothetical protein